MGKKIILFLFVLIYSTALTGCQNNADLIKPENGELVKITGYIMVLGTEPDSFIAVRSDDGKFYYIDKKYRKQFSAMQNGHYKFTGRVSAVKKNIQKDIIYEYLFTPEKWEKIK